MKSIKMRIHEIWLKNLSKHIIKCQWQRSESESVQNEEVIKVNVFIPDKWGKSKILQKSFKNDEKNLKFVSEALILYVGWYYDEKLEF